MRALILSTLIAGTAAVTAIPAYATPYRSLVENGPAMAPTLIEQGCGPGFHRNPYGYCRPNRYGYGFYGPRYYRPHFYGGYGYGPRFF